MSLLHQKHPRTRLELLLDELEFSFAQPESVGILPVVRIGVREYDFRGRLFHERAADRTLKNVARTLRREAHDAVQLSPSFRTIFGKAYEGAISQQPPELIHPANHASTIEHLPH